MYARTSRRMMGSEPGLAWVLRGSVDGLGPREIELPDALIPKFDTARTRLTYSSEPPMQCTELSCRLTFRIHQL